MTTKPVAGTSAVERLCAFCGGPIPSKKYATAQYCHENCRRKASYHRKSPEERREINKRSNDRRFKQDLLPIIRGLSKFPDEIAPGSPEAIYLISLIIVHRMKCWKFDHALNFNQVRNKLAEKAGGFDELERLEDEIFGKAMALLDKGKTK